MTGTKDMNPYTDPTKAATLSAKEICDIIKTCQRHNVSSFKFHELALEFGEQPKKLAAVVNTPADEQDHSDSEPDLDQMMVEDPSAYERFLSQERHQTED